MKKSGMNLFRTRYRSGFAAGGFLLLGLCAAAGAQKAAPADAPPPTPEQAAFFEKRVRPLLVNNCYSCHADSLQMGGLRLDSRAALVKGGASGTALVAGEPDKSSLITAVHYNGKVKMPPSGKLKADEIAALTAWVKMGAPWPQATPATASSYTAPAGSTKWWAFQPVRKPKPPVVKDGAWAARSPIDRFVLAKLEARGLKPAPPADRRTLIRRVYFDLIGLPPTPEEVASFVADKSPDAWEKVVDRLLASPHYGERWARHWLDVARYADSNGLDENKAFAHAFRYRDYVINALNKDKPYDQFVREQLAGDLLPPTEDETLRNERLTATGFLTLGAKVLAEQDKPKLVMDIVDEQIEVTSKAFLGLTVACARCHDHKFDPIPTKDYYGMAGIFKSTKTMKDLGFVSNWMERPLESKAFAAERTAYEAKRQAAEAEVKAAKEAANAEVVKVIRRDAAKYLLAGWELSRQPGVYSVADLPARPDETRLLIEAEDYARGNGNKDRTAYGAGIGVIHTVATPTFAEYDVTVPEAGSYQIELRYAAMEPRPVKLMLNGQVARGDAAGAVTGSWNPDSQRWELQGVFTLNAGKNVVRLERDGSIPHIDKVLIAAVKAPEPGAPAPRTAEEIAREHGGLFPGIVRRWAERLRGDESDPAFGAWHRLAKATDVDLKAEAARYADAFAAAEKGGTTPDREPLRKALYERNGLLTAPEKPDALYPDAAKAAIKKAADTLKELEKSAPQAPVVMAVEDDKPENVRVHLRGSTLTLGDEAPRGFLTVLSYKGQPGVSAKSSGRLELAHWLTSPKHPLTARVAVNRVWQAHFGEGLVRTPDNWGLRGEKPTHPELLDWLAATFVEQGWSFKRLHRQILLSNTYRMSTAHDPKAFLKDPENRLLWRANRRRLEAEPFRDALLSVSGKLDRTQGGSLLTTPNNDYVTNDQSGNAARYNAPRRSIYLPVIRNALFDYFQAFDFGDPTTVNARRSSTTVAPQALYVLNSPFVLEQSRAFALDLLARAASSDAQRVAFAYRKALGRAPTPAEAARATAFLTAYEAHVGKKEPDGPKRRERTWQGFCQVLFASNEFIYVE